MTIRARLTFWYAAVMLVSLLAMGALMYNQFAPEPHKAQSSPARGEEEKDESDFREALRTIMWVGIPSALLATLGGWWLMRRALAPVAALAQATERINDRTLNQPLPRSGNGDELDRLAEVLNQMTARLDGSFTRIREFTLHASHELKTPLTILRGETETELADESLTSHERERATSRLEEYRRLSRIVEGLTLLAKADAGQIKLAREPVRLDELVRDVFADAQILAQSSGLELKLAACERATVRGDRSRLRQLLLNLADNAVKYNVPQGRVTMGLLHVGDGAEFVVTNTGPGIPPEILPRVFDRFFRGDPAHASDVEGCGLGLSIAQWIASAHDGHIKIVSAPNKETTVTVHLPLSAEVKPA